MVKLHAAESHHIAQLVMHAVTADNTSQQINRVLLHIGDDISQACHACFLVEPAV